MKIITHNPPETLKSLIKQMWIIEENGSCDINVKSFPIGYSFINVIDGKKFKIVQDTNTNEVTSYLAGPKRTHFTLEMTYINRALTIQLQPYAIPLLFSIPAGEFYDHILPLADFDGTLSVELEDLVCSDLSSDQVLRKVSEVFTNMINDNYADNRVSAALSLLLISKGQIPISELAREVNLSQRRLQQLFQYYFGMAAKSYGRIIKMQYHTYQWLNGTDLDVVIPDGYYDQSHFIHDLKSQTGMLPSDFFNYVTDERNKPAYLNSNLYHAVPL